MKRMVDDDVDVLAKKTRYLEGISMVAAAFLDDTESDSPPDWFMKRFGGEDETGCKDVSCDLAEGVGFALGTMLGELQNMETLYSDSDTINVSHQAPSGVCADDIPNKIPPTSELFASKTPDDFLYMIPQTPQTPSTLCAPKTPDEILERHFQSAPVFVPQTPTEMNSPRTPDGSVPATPPLPESPDWSPPDSNSDKDTPPTPSSIPDDDLVEDNIECGSVHGNDAPDSCSEFEI